ncbi:MAG: hypothetical protein M3536_00220 [Actinomycetota bacterium]|nr:hypothetical protein [Actinomycetota bacterium]
MTKFRVGDSVRITHSPCRYFDQVGTVEDINEDQDHPFAVDGLEPWLLWFGPDEMVLAEGPTTGEAS